MDTSSHSSANKRIAVEEDSATQEAAAPPDFQPFFTLIEDPATGDVYHPRIHYVFSDDDQDLLTSTAIDELEAQDIRRDAEQRVVVIDIAQDGKTVSKVSSMSSNWQAVCADMSQAPSWGNDGQADGGMMLRINGKDNQPVSSPANASLDELLTAFDREMENLREVLANDDDNQVLTSQGDVQEHAIV